MPPDEPHQPATDDAEARRDRTDPFNRWTPPAEREQEARTASSDPEVDPPPGDPGVAEPPTPPEPGPVEPDEDPFDDDEVAPPPRDPEVTPPASIADPDVNPVVPPLFDDGVWGAVAAPPAPADRSEREDVGEAVPVPAPEPERHQVDEAIPVPRADPVEATAAHAAIEPAEPEPTVAAEVARPPIRSTVRVAPPAPPPSRRWKAAAWLGVLVMVIGVSIAFGVAFALVLVNLAVRSAG